MSDALGMSRSRTRAAAFAQGYRAFQEGLGLDSNPYESGGEAAERWVSGWKAAKARSIEHAPRGE